MPRIDYLLAFGYDMRQHFISRVTGRNPPLPTSTFLTVPYILCTLSWGWRRDITYKRLADVVSAIHFLSSAVFSPLDFGLRGCTVCRNVPVVAREKSSRKVTLVTALTYNVSMPNFEWGPQTLRQEGDMDCGLCVFRKLADLTRQQILLDMPDAANPTP
jgi:hypothetical protein